MADFKRIGTTENFCILGDLNISFSDDIYFTIDGREKLISSFEELGIKLMTKEITKNIDHIVLTKEFIADKKVITEFWNDTENKETRLSDHKGVFIEIFE